MPTEYESPHALKDHHARFDQRLQDAQDKQDRTRSNRIALAFAIALALTAGAMLLRAALNG